MTTTATTRSADGTTIAFETVGDGPPLVLVDPAGAHRGLGPSRGLASALADRFTAVAYDRRGRGESDEAGPWSISREVEDLAAIIAAVGGEASCYGSSSGSLLALHAAASGLPIPRLAVFEPPLRTDGGHGESDFTAELAALVAAGRRRDAVMHFMTSIGVPDEVLAGMEPTLPAYDAVAHTLVYDSRLGDVTTPAIAAGVTAPVLVLDSAASSDDLGGWSAGLVEALPDGTRRTLPGEWHGVPDAVVAGALADFLLT